MLLAAAFSQTQIIALGLLIISTGLLLRRSARRTRRVRNSDALGDAQRNMHRAEQSVVSVIRRMEVDLHDSSRDIEGRVQTRIAVLEELIVDADREMDRLQDSLTELRDLLDRTGQTPQAADTERQVADRVDSATSGPPFDLSTDEIQTVIDLNGVGFSPDEIARHLDCPQTDVQSALDALNRRGRADAA
jgi:hypothetical protein